MKRVCVEGALEAVLAAAAERPPITKVRCFGSWLLTRQLTRTFVTFERRPKTCTGSSNAGSRSLPRWRWLRGSSQGAFTQAEYTLGPPFPEPDEELYGIAAGGKMYVIGGFARGKAAGMVYEYDPATDKWTKKKPMARAAHHEALADAERQDLRLRRLRAAAGAERAERMDAARQLVGVQTRSPTRGRRSRRCRPARFGRSPFEVGGKFYVIGGAMVQPGRSR